MHEADLKMIARKVLYQEGQLSVRALLKERRIEEARDHVLKGIDQCFWNWYISFSEAAEFYNLLDLPLERIFKFPQRNKGAFF